MIYDMFYVCKNVATPDEVAVLKKRFPNIQILNNIESFSDIASRAFTKLFWVIWDNVLIDDAFDFNYVVPRWDQQYIHVFKNGNYFDGIFLIPKNANCSHREFENRFFIDGKKEIDVMASKPKPFDIIFISYNEPNADLMFCELVKRFPRAKRIHGVKGIHQAHIEAAKLSTTEMFWVVDADSKILDDFDFTFEQIPYYNKQAWINLKRTVHVWRSRNPINNLEYGYGGVKLLPKKLTIEMDTSKPDMTTSISDSFKVMDTVSNITAFNTDPFNTWKSAFRECVKLSSKVIDRQDDVETIERLQAWATIGRSEEYGEYAISGAVLGAQYGLENKNNIQALMKINDFEWLELEFKKHHER
jgi:hypothetical protein